MPKFIKLYVKYVDAVNLKIGRAVMYMIFVMMAVLLFSSITRGVFGVSFLWIVEVAQMLLAAYYLLGGGYSMQLDSHVRMDLLYSRWSPRTRARVDAATSAFLIFYLVVLLIGGISSTEYAIQYNQKNYSAWAPPLAPIKIVMTTGIALMLLQAFSMFFKDLAKAKGESLT
ncbi:TRAP transporter small permease subunit [Aestuariispira ectoiniformans]|uniref:TRAP transporter small permease subunit n=1 Tax=Aestuariispira ectoiniformans TaxID=2775080 RepID=UPI00223BC1AF|nr:TRAP transporter small permease subunit [Aestuariispira ectoiniformans]